MSVTKQRLSRIEDAMRRPSGPKIDERVRFDCTQDHLALLSDAQLNRFEELMIKVGGNDPDNKHQPLDHFVALFDAEDLREVEGLKEAMRFDCSGRHPAWCEWRKAP